MSTVRGQSLVGRRIGSGYRILELIGIGGTAHVYRARAPGGGQVAVKVLRVNGAWGPESRQRFAREAEVIGALRHPASLSLLDFGLLADGRPFLVTELLGGESLAALLERVGPLPSLWVTRILWQVADLLLAAHGAGVVHRDLKPENLQIQAMQQEGRSSDWWCLVRVLDFGLARVVAAEGLTSAGVVMGSPRYMSPEQGLGQSADPAADIYSLGVVAYHCLTGAPPFVIGTAVAELLAHIRTPPPELIHRTPSADPELAALVMRMLRKVPAERPTLEHVRCTLDRVDERLAPRHTDGTQEMELAVRVPTVPGFAAVVPRSITR